MLYFIILGGPLSKHYCALSSMIIGAVRDLIPSFTCARTWFGIPLRINTCSAKRTRTGLFQQPFLYARGMEFVITREYSQQHRACADRTAILITFFISLIGLVAHSLLQALHCSHGSWFLSLTLDYILRCREVFRVKRCAIEAPEGLKYARQMPQSISNYNEPI